jgi:hypothetical protein
MGWDQVKPPEGGGDSIAAYEFGKDGGLPGISTWVQHLANGVDWALLVNSSAAEHGDSAQSVIREKVLPRLRSVQAWPDGDLFGEFRGDVSTS